jgi:hypothetical protein
MLPAALEVHNLWHAKVIGPWSPDEGPEVYGSVRRGRDPTLSPCPATPGHRAHERRGSRELDKPLTKLTMLTKP